MDINKELVKGLTKEVRDKMRDCETTEDFIAVAQEEGFELTDEQLEFVSGGNWHCGSFNMWECTSGYWVS